MRDEVSAHRALLKEWERRLKADEARRKAEHVGTFEYVRDFHDEEFSEERLAYGPKVVTWRTPRGVLFMDASALERAIEATNNPDARSARDRAGRGSGDELRGDSLSGDAVPRPWPKVNQSKHRYRLRKSPVLAHPQLLRGVYVAFSLRWLGYVAPERKTKRPTIETMMIRRFLRHYYLRGWRHKHLEIATGLSRATVYRRLKDTDGLLTNLRLPDSVYTNRRASEPLCSHTISRDATEHVYTTGETFVANTYAGTWVDSDTSMRCTRCYRLVSNKISTGSPAQWRTSASKGRPDQPPFAHSRDTDDSDHALEGVST